MRKPFNIFLYLMCSVASALLYSCYFNPPSSTALVEPVAELLFKDADTLRVRCIPEVNGKGGLGRISNETLSEILESDGLFNVMKDLEAFSGLTTSEVWKRLRREGQYHFEGEHAWWEPKSQSELAWFYRGSVSYLFGNAIHPAPARHLELSKADGPVLDYSGGVGNNVLYLASKGIECSYFGIGEMEMAFAKFRVKSRNLTHLVTFHEPYVFNEDNMYKFDPIKSVPNRPFGTILLYDVLEHIPNYHHTLAHLAMILRVGGRIFEQSPFAPEEDDTQSVGNVHLSASVPLNEAMENVGMRNEGSWWRKIE